MNYQTWLEATIESQEDYIKLQQELLQDLEEQLSLQNLHIVKALPNVFYFGAVIGNAENNKWLHLLISDTRKNNDWYERVSLRRMSSERDWKGDAFHYCTWDTVGSSCALYMGDEYDDEIL